MEPLIPYLIIINALGFLLMLADKIKARKKKWRIPEASLMGVAVIGGIFGQPDIRQAARELLALSEQASQNKI